MYDEIQQQKQIQIQYHTTSQSCVSGKYTKLLLCLSVCLTPGINYKVLVIQVLSDEIIN